MDQQRYDYLAQQRNTVGGLTYDQAQAFDAADSRHEFDQFKQGQPAAQPGAGDQPQSNIAVQGPIGGAAGSGPAPTPPPPPPPTTTSTTLPNPDTQPGTAIEQPGSRQLIPTQRRTVEQPGYSKFADDLGLPPLQPGENVPPEKESGTRFLHAMDILTPEGRAYGGGLPHMLNNDLHSAFYAPGAIASQLGQTPEEHDMVRFLTNAGIPVALALRIAGLILGGGAARLLGR